MLGWSVVKRLQPGWVAVAPEGARARAAYVVRGAGSARPALRWAGDAEWPDAATGLRTLRRGLPLHQHRCVAVLQRHQYQLLPMDAPDVPRADWRDAARWRVKDMVDFAVEDAGIDLLEIPAEHSQRGRAGLLAAVAPRPALEALVQAADAARTPWQAIDLPDTALRNLCALGEEPGRGDALLWVGDTHGALVVTAQGELLLSRQVDLTLAQLDEADAERRQATWDRAALELQRTLDNVERQFNRVGLARLRVSPGTPERFVAYLRDLVYLPVLHFELGEAVDLCAVPRLAGDVLEQARYFCAIGAALRTDGAKATD